MSRWRENALWMAAGVMLVAVISASILWYRAIDVDTGRVDDRIRWGLESADRALRDIEEHGKAVVERVVFVRETVAEEVLSISGDELADRALIRAERFRGALASSDIRSADRKRDVVQAE